MLEAHEAGSWAGLVLNVGSVTYSLCSLEDKLLSQRRMLHLYMGIPVTSLGMSTEKFNWSLYVRLLAHAKKYAQ